MAMGRREGDQANMWVPTNNLARSPGHAFYDKLNEVLDAGGFERIVRADSPDKVAIWFGNREFR